MRLIVVRHATAKSKRAWNGRDDDRPLTANGEVQARAIAKRLARYRPARILSSPSLRCIQTVTPLATALTLSIVLSDALATDGGRATIDMIDELAMNVSDSSTLVLCTHREVLEAVLPALAAQMRNGLGHRLPGAKGGCWTIVYRDKKPRTAKYWHPSS